MEKKIAKHILSAEAVRKKTKIKIIIGDIIRISDVVHPKRLIGKEKALSENDHNKLWHNYEKVRFITSNECPSPAYFAIYKLCERGIIDSIITTNYDQYFESIFDKIPASYQLIKNPLLTAHCSYDWEGYYSSVSTLKKGSIKFFKIHGSFSHVIFKKCSNQQAHIFKLPLFLTAFSTKNIRKKLGGKVFHFSLNHKQSIDDVECLDSGYYIHFIDWLLENRKVFEREIAASIRNLSDVSNTGMILALGFTGRPDEELNNHVLDLIKKKIPFYYVISKIQYETIKSRENYLYHHLVRLGYPNIIVVDDFGDFLMNILRECGDNKRKLIAEYRHDWQSSRLFVPTSEIGGYVK